jgi:hypothetical protein
MHNTIYDKKIDKKFTKTFDMSDYQILTDSGFVDLSMLHQTVPYRVWELELSNGYGIECADDHIVFDDKMNEVFVKDLQIGDRVMTDNGVHIVISNRETNRVENMYDFELVDGSDRRYYTNGILSHNTELAKQIAKYMFDTEDSLIRLDMSEYMEKISISKIQGSSPGYVGYDDSNVLDKIRRRPYSVILFDEIEKAHPEIFNLFLQMLDDGHMTDSQGRKVSFKNCVILMTSNVGTRVVKDFGGGLGFKTKSKSETNDEVVKGILEKELKKKFSPEFINRLDEIIYFKDLSKEDILKIVDIELDKTLSRAREIGYNLVIEESLKEHLVEVGYDPQYGARPLKRSIQKWVDDYVTEFIIEQSPERDTTLTISYDKKEDVSVVSIPAPKKKRTTRKPKDTGSTGSDTE